MSPIHQLHACFAVGVFLIILGFALGRAAGAL